MKAIMEEDIDKLFLTMERKLGKTDSKAGKASHNQQSPGWKVFSGYGIEIPPGFEEASPDKAAKVFFTKNRPSMTLMNQGENAGLTFQTIVMEEVPSQALLKSEREQVLQVLKSADENIVLYDRGSLFEQESILWFDYKSFAIDEQVYNIIFLFFAGNDLIMGTFYCVFKDYDKWKPQMLNMLCTIEVKETKERERVQS